MRPRVLVVDGSLTVRMDIGDALGSAGFHALLCADLHGAAEALTDQDPALIVLDLQLPDGNGLDFLAALRNSTVTAHIPVLLLCTEDEDKDRSRRISQTGAGAEVYLGKPYDLDQLVAEARTLTRARASADIGAGRRVLAVDDSVTYLQELGSQLREEGYDVVLARSGEEALALLEARPADCILLDLLMPGLSGQDTCKLIKERAEWRDIPLIMLTARDDRDAMIEGINAGADDYIAKSSDFDVLKARLRAQLRRKHFEDDNRRIRETLVRRESEATARKQTNVELESAKSAAEKANLAKSDFLSSMSHELRSPLNAILGFAQLMELASPPPTDLQKESIAQILQAGWHLLKLINEILDLATVESGSVSVSRESVSLAEIMSECRSMMESQAQTRGITMTFPPFDEPMFISADRTRLKQIIINLLSNAIKYNKEHGTVSVSCAARPEGRTRISVEDKGAGLTPEKLAHLFQPFNRLGQEAGGVTGTGIGLVVTKRLAELMGGALGVESTAGVGSVFWCELASSGPPQLIAELADVAVFDEPPVPAGTAPRTILYVEDNQANMKLVEQLIARRPDLRLLTAVNGTLGIELARQSLPSMILMDINLPGISGVDALKVLRDDPRTANIPVVALSANAMPRDVETGLHAGFFRYLTKPIKVKEFMDTLNEALEVAKSGSG